MSTTKTHRLVKEPQITASLLADFMAGSERAARRIVSKCRYQPIARIVQHTEAKAAIAKFFLDGQTDLDWLVSRAQALRDRIADDDFERDVFDHNADYIDRFILKYQDLNLPNNFELLLPGSLDIIKLNGVKVKTDFKFILRRITKTNKVRIGAVAFRYAKGKPLRDDIGEWQSAFSYGYLRSVSNEDEVEAERQLCLTMDAYAGVWHSAPSDSVRRYNNIEAACSTIAEWWPNITPPPNAVF